MRDSTAPYHKLWVQGPAGSELTLFGKQAYATPRNAMRMTHNRRSL